MKRPFDYLTEISLQTVKKSVENYKFYFNQFDQILVWIVGFSITGISLIVSDFTSINTVFNKSLLSVIIILLGLSIIFGIIYRFTALFAMKKQDQILFYIEAAFSKNEMMNIVETKLDLIDVNEIKQRIEIDFGHDYSDIVSLYNNSEDLEHKEFLIGYLKEEHHRLSKWAKNEYDFSMQYIKDTFKEALKLRQKTVDKMFSAKDNDPVFLKIYVTITFISIAISVICFLTVICLLILNYIWTN